MYSFYFLKVNQNHIILYPHVLITLTFNINSLSTRDSKTCHRDKIARLTAPCPSHKKLKHKNFNILLTQTPPPMPTLTPRGSTIALPALCPGEFKKADFANSVDLDEMAHNEPLHL